MGGGSTSRSTQQIFDKRIKVTALIKVHRRDSRTASRWRRSKCNQADSKIGWVLPTLLMTNNLISQMRL